MVERVSAPDTIQNRNPVPAGCDANGDANGLRGSRARRERDNHGRTW